VFLRECFDLLFLAVFVLFVLDLLAELVPASLFVSARAKLHPPASNPAASSQPILVALAFRKRKSFAPMNSKDRPLRGAG
jgi:hypothetical protein